MKCSLSYILHSAIIRNKYVNANVLQKKVCCICWIDALMLGF
jgi:hypothetical protein